MQEYESDRWRIISTKVGHGFSAAACKTKAAELRPDLYEVEPEQGVGFVAEEEEQEELGVEEEVEGDDEEVEADESEVEEYSWNLLMRYDTLKLCRWSAEEQRNDGYGKNG